MPQFIKWKELSKLFYNEVVSQLLKRHYPDLRYSVALLWAGSDVIWNDTERSMDHDWGPRLFIFIEESDSSKEETISKMFSSELPVNFRWFLTQFNWDLEKNHRIKIYTIQNFFKEYIHFDIAKNIKLLDWLIFPEHKLLTISSGEVFHDEIWLKEIIQKFSYYPNDVWLYKLVNQWTRIAQEEHFMWRCWELGDEIWSRLIAARLVKDIMNICYLMERQYAPYIKWFWTNFKKLKCSSTLHPILEDILKSSSWKEREKHLSQAYENIAKLHNKLQITKELKTEVSLFFDRPFLVINGDRFASEIKKKISSKELLSIKYDIWSINQFADSTDVFESDTRNFRCIYEI